MLLKALAILSTIRRDGWAVTVRSDGDMLILTAEPAGGVQPERVSAEKSDPETLYKAACALARQCRVKVDRMGRSEVGSQG